MSVVTTAPEKAGLDIRTLRELAQSSISERERREAESAKPALAQRLRRIASIYGITLTTMIGASAIFFDLGGITVGQSQTRQSVVTAAGMTADQPQAQKGVVTMGGSQATTTVLMFDTMGFTVSIPTRYTSL